MAKYENVNTDYCNRPAFNALYKTEKFCGESFVIRGPVAPGDLKTMKSAGGLNTFRPATKQHEALVKLSCCDDGMVFIATNMPDFPGKDYPEPLKIGDDNDNVDNEENNNNAVIVSYVTFQKSDFFWWQKHSFCELLELGAMETDHRWRRTGITTALLNAIFNNPEFLFFEKKVVFTLQTVCNWDIRGIGISPWGYRRMMIRFFDRFGFSLYKSNDPEVKEDPCSFILGRIGRETPTGIEEKFLCSCMG